MANKLYSDLDFMFTRKPVTNDIALSYDVQAVTRSIRNLILTRHYDRPFNPDLGTNVEALLFELISGETALSIQNEIQTVIKNYEPRAILETIDVNPLPDKNAYNVTISFYLENTTLPTTITLLLERNR